MVIVKATNPNDTNSIWKFSQLDLNLLKMVIKGLWVYDILLDENEMKASLGMVLNHYPHLSGRVEHNGTGITMNNEGVSFYVKHQNNLKISDVQQIKNLHNYFNKGINIPGFVKGKTAPLGNSLWMSSINASVSIPRLEILRLFAGILSFDKANEQLQNNEIFLYEAGIELRLWKDALSVSVPLLISPDMKRIENLYGHKWHNRIRFVLNLKAINPFIINKKPHYIAL